ncbi:hypothetical protein PR048_008295 [Dryococelus australis]|uniref:PiggyBac transposable element-derived protein domain-containing protein n=1 Tax=Dryococelus australis TaxID=614101 RepID=A0ABQ9HYD1_9NEOP|nr:hypothetical protein PR048_008295 [Dryococelus australis]
MSTVKRYDRKMKCKLDIPCPRAILTYNKFIRGVGLLDGLMSYYRINIRSKSWLLYRRDCHIQNFPKKLIIDLLQFKIDVAAACVHKEKIPQRRKEAGRPVTMYKKGIKEKNCGVLQN